MCLCVFVQIEYQSEGVDASLVEYEDNRPILDMFSSEAHGFTVSAGWGEPFPQATDQTLVGNTQLLHVNHSHDVQHAFILKNNANSKSVLTE